MFVSKSKINNLESKFELEENLTLYVDGYESFIESARYYYNSYKFDVDMIKRQLNLENEAEIYLAFPNIK